MGKIVYTLDNSHPNDSIHILAFASFGRLMAGEDRFILLYMEHLRIADTDISSFLDRLE